MSRLERHQVWVYLAAILAGLGLGTALPGVASLLEAAVWPTLALLLYATFTQVPFLQLWAAFRDGRFISAVLTGNFAILPLVVWALLQLAPAVPAVRLGILLVLLVPCTDWFITFTHLAGGDTSRAVAVTPLNLLLQLVLLPLYLWLFLGEAFVETVSAGHAVTVFATLILVPLLAAWVTQRRAGRRSGDSPVISRLGSLTVPLLALVVFLIAASQVATVAATLALLPRLALIYGVFLLVAAVLGRAVAWLFQLAPAPTRTVMFSFGTRNSFVVLPVALALPDGWQAAVVVIVFQSLVELFGMVAYLWAIPRVVPVAPTPRR